VGQVEHGLDLCSLFTPSCHDPGRVGGGGVDGRIGEVTSLPFLQEEKEGHGTPPCWSLRKGAPSLGWDVVLEEQTTKA
jgi:hypothetical protein